ncbi:MAG: hypothetical protein EPGJADBJ_03441 [Saprospiraceae bacterium]|nr:hypothetical protein [Saprospiraceae bacterium]
MTLRREQLSPRGSTSAFDNQSFFEALGRAEPAAIRQLAAKIVTGVRQMSARAGLSPQDAEEILNDAVVITISNIREGKFRFMDFSPATYASGVARKLIANRVRVKKPAAQELDNLPLLSDMNPEAYVQDKERQKLVGQLLQQLEETCRQLIQLKYFNTLRDEEIIDKQLTPFTSVNSLKSKRSQCLKKLAGLALEAGITSVI